MKTRWSLLMVLALLAALFSAPVTRADGPAPAGIVGTGSGHTCALTPSGAVDCWGDNSSGEATDQPGPYTQVSAGWHHTCALTPSGAVDCWGKNNLGQATDQPGPYTQASAGGYHTCALTPSGAVDCWGNNDYGQATDQPGPYTQVSAGAYHNCALTPSGAVDCWGANFNGQATDQPGPYTQVSAGAYHNCALMTPSGEVDCWGYDGFNQATDQPGPYIQVSAGDYHTCALTPSGGVECWGNNDQGEATDQPGPYTRVSAGGYHTCALTPSGGVDCWGYDNYGQATDQPGPYGPYNPNLNAAPVADPGGPYLGAIDTAIAFDGSGSSDPDGDPLTYDWSFGDGGAATGAMPTHSYAAAAVYNNVCLTVNDGTVDSETACTLAVVYDPSAGFVTGGGWINSPAGAYEADPALTGKATFGFVSKYKKGAQVPTGTTQFQFDVAGLSFYSETYEWLVVNQGGTNAQFKGSGTINDGLDPNGNWFKFMIWAGDSTPDTFHIRIWWEAGGVENDVYDNGTDQAIGAGNIVVHTGK